jgi:DNA-binding transcriptional MerR regulator
LVPIAQLARRLDITPRTLRHYQDQGLIRSHRVAHNARAYDLETVADIELIVTLRDAGLSITTIRDILRSDGDQQSVVLRAALSEVQAEAHQRIADIDNLLQVLSAAPDRPPRHLLSGRSQARATSRKGSDPGSTHQESQDDLP